MLHEKGGLSIKTQQILKNNLNNALVTPLFTNTEFWDSNKTLKVLIEGNYFKSDDYNLSAVWPEVLRQMLDESMILGLTSLTSINETILTAHFIDCACTIS